MPPTAELPVFLDTVAPILDRWGYWAIGGVIVVESFGVPAPGQTIMVAGSIYAGLGRMNIWVVALITMINFLYLLTQIVIAADDCGVADALSRVARLLVRQGRTIAGVLGAILALLVLTTAASVLAAAALGLIAFVPFVGLAVLPLQAIAWLVRGLVFQYISLAGAAAYLRLHRQASLAEVRDTVARGERGLEILRS